MIPVMLIMSNRTQEIAYRKNCPSWKTLRIYCSRTLLLILTISALPMCGSNDANNAVETNDLYENQNSRECESVDIRYDCANFSSLIGCTVIKGHLSIMLLPRSSQLITPEKCDFNRIRFPLLREITDYLILYDVKGLITIRNMFPNLTVIRGRRLFLNYALGISSMPNLELIEFKSLVAIQRGHVYIGSNRNLCNLNKINWDRLTLTTGENHVFPAVNPEMCPANMSCAGCNTEYCWSHLVCQKFENDNVVNLYQGSHHCHVQCLGGCYNATKEGCVVCKSYMDHGSCVDQCPPDKYAAEHFQRCYTQNECVEDAGFYTHGFECVYDCPSGFVPNDNGNCVPCHSQAGDCIKICQSGGSDEAVFIYNLADADRYKGCQIINSSLVITIRNKVNELELYANLKDVQEIRGHLKVSRSPHLTSLKFLKNLRKISGEPLESELYAFIVYDNKNLEELWEVEKLALERGSMYVHLNNKLCNHKLSTFRKRVVHSTNKDTLQVNDQEVMCDPSKMMLYIEVLTFHSLRLLWPKEQTTDKIEILYRPLLPNEEFTESSELDSNVCTRVNWQRELKFPDELHDNGTHYSYLIDGLTQNTKYACLVKTFGQNDDKNARSDLKIVNTRIDVPRPPIIQVSKKTDMNLTFQLYRDIESNDVINYFLMELFEIPDDTQLLDKRNYCDEPLLLPEDMPLEAYTSIQSNRNEDYDDCCTHMEAKAEDVLFSQNMRNKFRCSLAHKEYCQLSSMEAFKVPSQSLRLECNETIHTINHLERFRLYVLQIQACNQIGCSSYSMYSGRTSISVDGDKIDDLHACHIHGTTKYRVFFSEPKNPNGVITSYMIHFRIKLSDGKSYRGHLICITRLQHVQSNNHFVTNLNSSFEEVAVRVHSIAGDIMTKWINITICSAKMTSLSGPTIPETSPSHRINVFLLFFLFGAGGTLIWVCYKRRLWRRLSDLHRFLPCCNNWGSIIIRTETNVEDRQILVDEFETVHFHNNSDDELKYLSHVN